MAGCVLASIPLIAALAGVGSCTTFDGLSPAPPAATQLGSAYLPLKDAARVCALAFSCPNSFNGDLVSAVSIPFDTLNFSVCMHWMAGPIPTNRIGFNFQQQTLQCLAKASSCSTAYECLPFETLVPGDPRCAPLDAGAGGTAGAGGGLEDASADGAEDAGAAGASGASGGGGSLPDERCGNDGGAIYKCQNAYKYALNCGNAYYAPGSHCVADTDGTRWCAVGDNCNVYLSCIGSLLDYCGGPDGWTHESINCAYGGRSCGQDSDSGVLDCLTGSSLRKCYTAGTTCVDSTVEVCDGLSVSLFDCSSIKATCSKSEGTARCMRNDDACKPSDPGINVCSGDVITLCVGGRKVSLDCKGAGLTCKPGAGAQSAHCG